MADIGVNTVMDFIDRLKKRVNKLSENINNGKAYQKFEERMEGDA